MLGRAIAFKGGQYGGTNVKRHRRIIYSGKFTVGSFCSSRLVVVYSLCWFKSFAVCFYRLVSNDVDFKEMRDKMTLVSFDEAF